MAKKAQAEVVAEAVAQHDEHLQEITPDNLPVSRFIKAGAIHLAREKVVCFTNFAAGYERLKLNSEMDRYQKQFEGNIAGFDEEADEYKVMADRLAELATEVWETRIEVHMMTVPPRLKNAIYKHIASVRKSKGWDDQEHNSALAIEFWRHSIEKVYFAETDETEVGPMTAADCEAFMESLPDTESDKVIAMADVLTNGVELADQRIDAGFPGGSPDEAAELPGLGSAAGSDDSGDAPSGDAS